MKYQLNRQLLNMKYQINEVIETTPWQEGMQNAPAELATKAKNMIDMGMPAVFGTIAGTQNWVVLGISEQNNQLYVAHRAAT
jgi:hypothetical protein